MKIECIQSKIRWGIGLAERISGKHMTLPVLSCLLLEAEKDSILKIKATNLDLGIEINVPARVYEPGIVAVPANTISAFIGGVTDEDKSVKIESNNDNIKILTQKSSGILKTQPNDDFPDIPKVSGLEVFSINCNDFIKGLKSVWYSSSVSSIKPELSSVYIYCENDFVVFVATDSFRLAEKRIKIRKNKDFGQILIPYKNIPDILRVLEGCNDDIEVRLDKNQISFSYHGVYLVSRVIDGVFPDYKQIIPKQNSTEVTVLKQDLINTLKLSNVFSDKFNQVSMSIKKSVKKFEIKTKNNDIGENTTTLDAVIQGEDLDINFNYKYIIDCFQSIDSDSVTLNFNGLNKPLVIIPVSDNTFRYIVMPMNR